MHGEPQSEECQLLGSEFEVALTPIIKGKVPGIKEVALLRLLSSQTAACFPLSLVVTKCFTGQLLCFLKTHATPFLLPLISNGILNSLLYKSTTAPTTDRRKHTIITTLSRMPMNITTHARDKAPSRWKTPIVIIIRAKQELQFYRI